MMFSFNDPHKKEKRYYFNEKTRKHLIHNGNKCVIFGTFLIALSALITALMKL